MGEQRCQVVEITPAIDYGVPVDGDILCGLPLEPTGGSCEHVDVVDGKRYECKMAPFHHYELRNTVPPPPGSQWSSDREYYPGHEYQSPLACPLHGEQGGQR